MYPKLYKINLLFICIAQVGIAVAKSTHTIEIKTNEIYNQPNILGLKKLQSDIDVLLHQTLHYHWNLEGKQFNDYHNLFRTLYQVLFEDLDTVAERIRAVGGYANISMQDMLSKASIKEERNIHVNPKDMIRNLLKQYQAIIANIKILIRDLEKPSAKNQVKPSRSMGNKKMLEQITEKQVQNHIDHGTINMLHNLIEKYEKTAWMLKSLSKK